MRFSTATSVVAFLFAWHCPAAAEAKTKTVYMGPPPKSAKQLRKGVDVNAFFPSTITVHVGDSVAFAPVGFHNVDLAGRRASSRRRSSRPSGQTVAGVRRRRGRAVLVQRADRCSASIPRCWPPGFGKKFTLHRRQGASRVRPARSRNKPKPMTVKFTKAGHASRTTATSTRA